MHYTINYLYDKRTHTSNIEAESIRDALLILQNNLRVVSLNIIKPCDSFIPIIYNIQSTKIKVQKEVIKPKQKKSTIARTIMNKDLLRGSTICTTVEKVLDLSEKFFDRLTDAEKVVVKYLILGYSNNTIGKFLQRSTNTVKAHRASIYRKYELDSSSIALLIEQWYGWCLLNHLFVHREAFLKPNVLTSREYEIYNKVIMFPEATVNELAEIITGISVHTAKAHVCNILSKLGLNSRVEIIHDYYQRQFKLQKGLENEPIFK